jgi:hypothetical protein
LLTIVATVAVVVAVAATNIIAIRQEWRPQRLKEK